MSTSLTHIHGPTYNVSVVLREWEGGTGGMEDAAHTPSCPQYPTE